MHFNLHIALGNADMDTGADLATALKAVAKAVNCSESVTEEWEGKPTTGVIFDANGNRVGNWRITQLP